MSAEELISIDTQELIFPFEPRKQISCPFELSNKTDNHLAFKIKVKTNNIKNYSVQPNCGIVLPRSRRIVTVTVQARRQAPPDMKCKDKFQVRCVFAPPAATLKDINEEMFNKEEGNHVEEFILRVVYVDLEEETSTSSSTCETHMFIDDMKNRTALIRSCSKINPWNLHKKNVYLMKLQDSNNGLIRFFANDVLAHQVRSTSSWLSDNFGDGELPELVVGLDLPLEELKVMLLEEKVPMQPVNSSSMPPVVLLSAPPGCGKTMLANMVCRDSTIEDKFKENIFFVTVSKRVTVKVIVQKVFQQKGCIERLLEFRSDKDAINELRIFLERIGGAPDYKPILLVLDDVRSPGLKSLVHKFMFEGIQGYKILVTSRFDPLGFQSVYRLKLLNYQDAKVLFRHYAFLPGRPHPHVPDYLVNEIVRGCKGFPLALIVLGLSLCGKHGVFWKNTLNKWSKGKSDIFYSNIELLNNLRTILDAEDEDIDMEKVKECFLHLRSFHEDQISPATALTDSNGDFPDMEEGMDTYDNLSELPTRSSMAKEGSFCHVFLSFRGEIRNDFTCYLYDALKADGFLPFMDRRDMYAGDDVQLSIEEGIKNSMSAIVIFSKNYAFSTWCLDELILILERKRTSKYFIIPILYGVKSADVKHQLGSFKEALEKHKVRYDEERIEKWRAALKEAGKILAEHFDGTVPDFIQKVVKLFRKRFSDNFAGYSMPL